MALAIVDVELPAVVAALKILSIETAAVERHAAMRAGVAEGEGMTKAVAAKDEWDFEQRGFIELIAVNAIGGQGAIPEAGEHERVGRLAVREVEVGHGRG